MSELAYETSDMLCRLARAIDRHCAAALKPLGLSASDYAVLGGLGTGEVGSQGKLAAASGVHPTSVVSVLDRLERCGFVRRCTSPCDRSRNLIRLTAEGIDALRQARHLSAGVADAKLASLNPGDRARLHDLLARVAWATHQ